MVMQNKKMLLVVAGLVIAPSMYANTQKKKTNIGSSIKKDVNTNINVGSVAKDAKVDLKIRCVDSSAAIGNSEEGKKIAQEFESKRKDLMDGIKQKEQKLVQATNELKSKMSTLSESARNDEQKKLVSLERNYKNALQEAEESLKLEMQQKTEYLSRKFNDSVREIAQADKVDLLVDARGQILYASEKSDYTLKIS